MASSHNGERTSTSEARVISFRQWRARHLFWSWGAYWLALLGVVAWRPLLEYWRITRSPTGHGTVRYVYSGDMLAMALWIAGPPLVLFVAWTVTRSRAPERSEERVGR
jgi:hypothetical protein